MPGRSVQAQRALIPDVRRPGFFRGTGPRPLDGFSPLAVLGRPRGPVRAPRGQKVLNNFRLDFVRDAGRLGLGPRAGTKIASAEVRLCSAGGGGPFGAGRPP
eukprot:7341061-Pyramimonas_sp.AAC.2